ncbi:MAG: hypothetical protein M1829_001878 [Trizodia sp. TS-e1964]|nr:MAG: hypothetical protein M1829_001878 [Trizodia sp. TS-e1964]
MPSLFSSKKRVRNGDESNKTIAPRELPPPQPAASVNPPRLLIIGAGSRGKCFARAVMHSTNGIVVAVAEPDAYKRKFLGKNYIWGTEAPTAAEEFESWQAFLAWELKRRESVASGAASAKGIDGVIVCTLDETHAEIILALAPLKLHILCEKPLATNLKDCLGIYKALLSHGCSQLQPGVIFGIGHVLRYSPHNMLLRKLLLEDRAIGEVISMEHTEPVGWWHFAHSYVRGNWRKESTSAPSLLTKSCHDIDLILWLLCSSPDGKLLPHLPSSVTSSGSLVHFKKSRKPALAGNSTNCLSCPAEAECQYSAKRIYHDRHLMGGNTGWPVSIVVADIESCVNLASAKERLLERLREDYDGNTSPEAIDQKSWYGRCVYESANDVCDDQVVTIRWEEPPVSEQGAAANPSDQRGAKTALFHMVAFTDAVCDRRSRIYGSHGEIEANSTTIQVHDFRTGQTQTHRPHLEGGGHGGGDFGLARQFVLAIDAVKNQQMGVGEAQTTFVGCTLEEVIRSHAMVFAAEDARNGQKVVDWAEWWAGEVEAHLDKAPQ